MLDGRRCDVNSAADLDMQIRDIFALDQVGRADEISGTLYVDYVGEATRQASLIPALERRGVEIVWRKKPHVRKGYIRRMWQAKPTDTRDTIDFSEFAKDAGHYESRERARLICDSLAVGGITIPSAWGGIYICHEFIIEEVAPGDLVICFEAPFIYTPKESD